MNRSGISPMKAARSEEDVPLAASSNQQQQQMNNNNNNNSISENNNRLEPSANIIASCSGQHFFATVTANRSKVALDRVVQLEVFRYTTTASSSSSTNQHHQHQQQLKSRPDFSVLVVLPQSFFRHYNNNEQQQQLVLFIGEGTDGSSVVICDSLGNAGTVSVVSNYGNTLNTFSNNNNNNASSPTNASSSNTNSSASASSSSSSSSSSSAVAVTASGGQVYLHTSPIGKQNNNNNNNNTSSSSSSDLELSAFACINGDGIFCRLLSGRVTSFKVLDRESASDWIVVTSYSAPSVQDLVNARENAVERNILLSSNNNNNNNQKQQNGGWGSWIGSFFSSNQQQQQEQNNQQQDQQDEDAVNNFNSKNKNMEPRDGNFVQAFYPSYSTVFTNQQQQQQQQSSSSSSSPSSAVPLLTGWFSIHNSGRVVYHGNVSWAWQPNDGSRVYAVGDAADDSGSVYILLSSSSSNEALTDNLRLGCLSLKDSNASNEFHNIKFPRLLHERDDLISSSSSSSASASSVRLFPVRLNAEKRVIIVTPQSSTAHTVAIGPRTPYNEVTLLETNRFILAAHVTAFSHQNGNLLLLTSCPASSPAAVFGIAGSSVLSASSHPVALVFSSLDCDMDQDLQEDIAEFGKDAAFVKHSEERSCADAPNPWTWARASSSSSSSSSAGNNSIQLKHQRNEDMNMITFVTNSLAKRTTGHRLFVRRWQDHDFWNDISDATRATLLFDHQTGLNMLTCIRAVQNDCSLHPALERSFNPSSSSSTPTWAQQQQQQLNQQTTEFDLIRCTSQIFAELLPACISSGKIKFAPAFHSLIQQQSQQNNDNNNRNNNNIATSTGLLDAEIVFGHPHNASVLLVEAANFLKTSVHSVNVSVHLKLMRAAVIGSLWYSAANAINAIRNPTSGGADHGLWQLIDYSWLDQSLPVVIQACSDAVALAVDSNFNASSSSAVSSGGSFQKEREMMQTDLLDLVADLIMNYIDLAANGKISAHDLLCSTLLREPFLRSSRYGYPFEGPSVSSSSSSSGGSFETCKRAFANGETVAIRQNVLPTLFQVCSSATLMSEQLILEDKSSPSPSSSSSATAVAGGKKNTGRRVATADPMMITTPKATASSFQQNSLMQQKFAQFCQVIPGFFEYAALKLLEQKREVELGMLHSICPEVLGVPTSSVRSEFLLQRQALQLGGPSALWSSSSSGSGSGGGSLVNSLLTSSYECPQQITQQQQQRYKNNNNNCRNNNSSSGVSTSLASTAIDHRGVCLGLAKLAWVADGRTLRAGREIEIENKVAQAQRRFLPQISNKPLSQTECIRALLSQPINLNNNNNNNSNSNNNNFNFPGENLVVACELSDLLHREDPARASFLREILHACFKIEGATLLEAGNNQSVGDRERLRTINESLTARTLSKSADLVVLCQSQGGVNADATIANTTSPEFGQLLHQWQKFLVTE